VKSYEYEPCGMPTILTIEGDTVTTATTSAVGNRFLFTGREWDADLEMYHYRHRTYSPRNHRFMQGDPIGLAGGWNYYAYCGGNPVMAKDPMGLDIVEIGWPLPVIKTYFHIDLVIELQTYHLRMYFSRIGEEDGFLDDYDHEWKNDCGSGPG